MKIASLTIENFRSITSAKKIPFSQYTLLVGPNNEGKSNILKALNAALNTLQKWRPRKVIGRDGRVLLTAPINRRHGSIGSPYEWKKDFPLHLQDHKTKKRSEITIEFELDDHEVDEFVHEIGSNLNGTLPIKIAYDEKEFEISIAKPGRGSVTLNRKTTRIAEFVSRRIGFDYVPAVRTAGSAEYVVRELVSGELSSLEEDERYLEALQVIENLQQPILDTLSNSITETVSAFLPSVAKVVLRPNRQSRSNFLRSAVQIEVDDGTPTDLERKGDGVQSLVALALMRHAADSKSSKGDLIVAIEEPESHLHPKAIRDLRDVIFDLSTKSQVIISSHSPLLVKWEGDTSTIIVGNSKALVAQKISEVRDCLGVQVSDNLQSVEFVLFVEGETDRNIINHIISCVGGESLKPALSEGVFGIVHTFGAGKLAYSLSQAEQNILGRYVFYDNDEAGRGEIKRALKRGALKDSEYTLCACKGMRESEIEDIIDSGVYSEAVLEKFGVDVANKVFKRKGKWSTRMKGGFEELGKIWDGETEAAVKHLVSKEFVKKTPEDGLMAAKRQSLDALLSVLNKAVSR